MKKLLIFVISAAFCLTPAMSMAGSCGGDHSVKASTKAEKPACGVKTAPKLTSSTAADKHPGCVGGTVKNCTPEECAEWKKFCDAYEGKCEMRVMSVKGMTCGGCESAVTGSLTKVAGVLKVFKVSHKDEMAIVCVDPNKLEADETLTTAVTNKGYKAEIMPAVATAPADSKAGKGCSPACKKICPHGKGMKTEKKAEGSL